MRERIVEALGDLPRARFLVYLMGPYTMVDVEGPLGTEPSAWPTPGQPQARQATTSVEADDPLSLLLFVRDRLRTDVGVNAFLALDVGVSLDEMDAATQSVEFALVSNAVVYVVPRFGDNLGVGVEAGAVLEAMLGTSDGDHRSVSGTRNERVLFVHESGITSAMVAAVHGRWDARVCSYSDRADLIRQIRLFVRDVMRREFRGDLPRLD